MNSEISYVIDVNERDLEKLSEAELTKMIEKLQNKAKKPKIAIVDYDNGHVPPPIVQLQKPTRCIPPRDPKTGRFVKIHPDRTKPPKQPTLPLSRDAKGRFVSRQQSEPIVQQPPIQILIGKPLPAPTIKNRAPKIEKLDQALKGHAVSYMMEIQDSLDPLNHFTKTKEVVESHLKDLLKTMEGFKFIITLEVTFEKNTFDSKTGKRGNIHKTAYFNSKS